MFTTLRQDKNVTQLLVIIFISSIIILFSFPLTHNKEKDVQSLDPLNIEIGVMSATSEDYPKYKHLANVALENINNYCIENRLPYSFEFVYSNGEGMASKALGNLQMYHKSGIVLQ